MKCLDCFNLRCHPDRFGNNVVWCRKKEELRLIPNNHFSLYIERECPDFDGEQGEE